MADNIRNSAPAGAISRTVGGIAIVVLGAVALYYLYNYLYGTGDLEMKSIVQNTIPGDTATKPPLFPILPIYEGGEYSVSFFIYITGFKDQLGKNKHILDIRGANFSTLAVGLGAFTNKLIVRVHTSGTEASNLSTNNIRGMFDRRAMPTPSALLDAQTPMCDLPEVDLQRYVNISIVMNGRTVDVYMDGKLARSCVLPSFFKVDPDPRGVFMKLLDFGGFDGFLSDVNTYNYALNPDQAWRIYMAGPSDIRSTGWANWLKGLFDVKGTVTYQYPTAKVLYRRDTVNFT